MLSEKLKEQTLTGHQQLEKNLVMQMRSMRSTADYIKLLGTFFSYFSALEDRINLFIGQHELPDFLQRRKTASLAADIEALGGQLPEKVSSASVPVIKNSLQAFGALYVIEGSTLGGQYISQMIIKQLGLTSGLSFFSGYGTETNKMWDDFKIKLNAQAKNDQEEASVIAAADDTFAKFKIFIDSVYYTNSSHSN